MATEIISRADARARGLKRFFTGIPCKQGHICERFTANNDCHICHVSHGRKWLSENREHSRSYHRLWDLEQKKKCPEKKAEQFRSWAKKQIEANPNWDRERGKAWRTKNPEASLAILARRRARLAEAPGSHTSEDLKDILRLQKGKCAHCRKKFGKNLKPSVDHILALSRGGSNDRKNLQFLCGSCNSRKHTRDPMEFSRMNGMLL